MVKLCTTSPVPSQADPTASDASDREARIFELLVRHLTRIGYDLVHLEIQLQRHKVLRLYIDFLDSSTSSVGIQDCVAVTKFLDPFFETDPEFKLIDSAFGNQPYELEVSSPGVERPLRRPKDYLRFIGDTARIHTLRPLHADEIGSADYCSANPKQKNFKGEIVGFESGKILLIGDPVNGGAIPGSKGSRKKGEGEARSALVLQIPLALVSRAHLEPTLEQVFERKKEANPFEINHHDSAAERKGALPHGSEQVKDSLNSEPVAGPSHEPTGEKP